MGPIFRWYFFFEVAREVIAGRIIAVARLGERGPARLLEAALCEPT
jgi:hypothetical protein